MIADLLSNKKRNPVVTQWFITSRKLNISLVFITQSCFAVPKNIRLNSKHYYENSKQTIWPLRISKKCAAKPYSFLVIDATIASDNPWRFRNNFVERILKTNHDNWW